jgi:hypothetical protein
MFWPSTYPSSRNARWRVSETAHGPNDVGPDQRNPIRRIFREGGAGEAFAAPAVPPGAPIVISTFVAPTRAGFLG